MYQILGKVGRKGPDFPIRQQPPKRYILNRLSKHSYCCFRCTVCRRGFTQQIDLQRHLAHHTGKKPFKCHLCKAKFIRADYLRRHCKDAHCVSIEKPIRKRRRKVMGSDTVLPPLEVVIALALDETKRNGGRVLGRAVTRTQTKSTTTKPRFAFTPHKLQENP